MPTPNLQELNTRRKRVLQTAVCMVLVSVLTTTCISVYSLNSVIQSNARSLTRLLSSSICDAVLGEVFKISMVTRSVSNDALLINILRIEDSYPEDYIADRIDTYLAGIKKGIQFDTAFIVSSSTHKIYGHGARVRYLDVKNPRDAWFSEFIDKGRPRATRVQTDTFDDGKHVFLILSRMNDEESRMLGMCGIGFPLEHLQNILRSFEKNYNVEISLIDWDERCMLATDQKRCNTTIAGLPENFRKTREFSYQEDEDGSYVLTRYLHEIGWFMVVKGEHPEGREAFSALIIANVLAIVLIFAVLFLVTHFLMRREGNFLEHRARTDPLTGVLNRAGFEHAFHASLENGVGSGALFLLDLDKFKEINDHLGHPEGDLLLQHTATTLKSLFRDNDSVARLGGDEFIIFAKDLHSPEAIAEKAHILLNAITQDFTFDDGNTCRVTASIGIAIFPVHGADYKSLYSQADAALYRSKKEGRNRFTLSSQPVLS